MVGVVVGVEDGVDELDIRAEQLQPQFRRGVDEDVAARRVDEDRAAVAVVRGLVERQTAQSQPIIGTPTDVPVPRKVNVRGPSP